MNEEQKIENHPLLKDYPIAETAWRRGYVSTEEFLDLLNSRMKLKQKVDYEELLRRCMEQWFDCEGCCWNGEDDKTLTEEERESVMAIHDELEKQYKSRVARNQLLEDYDEELGRIPFEINLDFEE